MQSMRDYMITLRYLHYDTLLRPRLNPTHAAGVYSNRESAPRHVIGLVLCARNSWEYAGLRADYFNHLSTYFISFYENCKQLNGPQGGELVERSGCRPAWTSSFLVLKNELKHVYIMDLEIYMKLYNILTAIKK